MWNFTSPDLIIGCLFFSLTCGSFWRTVSQFNSYRINEFGSIENEKNSMMDQKSEILLFNSLIFFASLNRSAWFLVPNNLIEISYTPTALIG